MGRVNRKRTARSLWFPKSRNRGIGRAASEFVVSRPFRPESGKDRARSLVGFRCLAIGMHHSK